MFDGWRFLVPARRQVQVSVGFLRAAVFKLANNILVRLLDALIKVSAEQLGLYSQAVAFVLCLLRTSRR